MKVRTCGLFWYKAVVTLRFASPFTPGQPQQTVLIIARPKVFGGKMEISLDHNTASLLSVSRKQERKHQFKIRYSRCFQVTLRAPTSAIYETWWAAFESALASPNFVVLPVIDARAHQVTIAPVQPARCNEPRPKYSATLDTVVEEEHGDESSNEIAMLEEGGPSSPTETDILASWRTWASLDYFATPPSITDPFSNSDSPHAEVESTISSNKDDNGTNSRISASSDISEFWSRPSEWEDETLHVGDPVPTTTSEYKSPIAQHHMFPEPQDSDDQTLDEIALFAFRQKVGAICLSEHRPSTQITG
ncbi:hypothetical protein PHMEG_00030482 [Phytophthora megakarya]|uniref:PH domain-containing protein n=1 Tax=Phytophthora megakarya TaxID=4795 RepID=A0A225V072_9STRA|nr:hypothetical protein PHMEG_00030482 [Phytophthora megakarya]